MNRIARRLIEVAGICLAVAATPAPGAGQQPLATGGAEIVECPGLDYETATGLAGLVRERDADVTIPSARVMATWVGSGGERGARSVEAGPDGAYVLCGLPTDTRLTVTAGFASYLSEPLSVQIEPGPPAGWDFEIQVDEGALRGDAAFPGRIVGTVFDRSSERPIESAQLTLMGDDLNQLSDGNGKFSFADLTPGVYRVAVHHIAYDRMEQIVQVPGNRTVEVRFNLSADPIELEPLVVTVVRDARLETRGFYDRQEIGEKVGNGVFLTVEDIERLMPTRLTNLLQWIPGVQIDCSGGTRNCKVIMRRGNPSLSSFTGQNGCVNSNVYVDGIRVIRDNASSDESIDNFVHPSEIAGMEVYRSASEVPAEFGGSVGRCGAIVIWTGSGGGG